MNRDHFSRLKEGTESWNQWRTSNPELRPVLCGTDLSGANLRGANLSESDVRGADLSGADLLEVNFSWSMLSGANLSKARAQSANFTEASLIETDVSKAELSHAIFREAHLIDTNFSGAALVKTDFSRIEFRAARFTDARFDGTSVSGSNLMEALDLESAHHIHESSLGLDTILLSGGSIPDEFVRGCGYDPVVQTLLVGSENAQIDAFNEWFLRRRHAIEWHSCFISYSSNDNALAKKLYDDLWSNGVRSWYAPEDLSIGAKTRSALHREIHVHRKLLLILSIDSIRSEWVADEVETAIERENETGELILFPIRIDDAVKDAGHGWAASIRRRRNVGDFRGWEDDTVYRKALQRVLRDLRQSSAREAGEDNA